MKNKLSKGISLSLSANPISLIRGAFFVATNVFTEFFGKFKVFENNAHRAKLAGGTKTALLAHVILCLVHRIFWQRISNLVNKLAILLKRSMFAQDSRDKPENDGGEGRLFSICCESVKRMYHSGSSANELSLKAKDDVSGWGGGLWLSVFNVSTRSVILRRYSLLEVPRRRIHNAIAYAMSMFNNTPHSALKRHSLPQGAREELCVAFCNKVMDTRLPQPVGCGDKYDVESRVSGCLRLQCAPDAKGFLSDVYKSSTLAKKLPADGVQGGRSMIEMLGVLAIIAVLSVGGIAGYSKAMDKFKTNKALDQANMIINNIKILYSQQKTYDGLGNKSAIATGIVSEELVDSGCTLKNSYGGTISICSTNLSTKKIRSIRTDNKAFSVAFSGLSKSACIALASQNLGLDGLIAVHVQGFEFSSSVALNEGLNCTSGRTYLNVARCENPCLDSDTDMKEDMTEYSNNDILQNRLSSGSRIKRADDDADAGQPLGYTFCPGTTAQPSVSEITAACACDKGNTCAVIWQYY